MRRGGWRTVGAMTVALLGAGCTDRGSARDSERGARPEPAGQRAAPTSPVAPVNPRRETTDSTDAATPRGAAAAPSVAGTVPLGQDSPLPPSERVFAAALDGDATTHLLGAMGRSLWAAEPTTPGRGILRWQIEGPGVAHLVATGDRGRGHRLFVAWGVGRGHLYVPLVLSEIDPKSGVAVELWRNHGERNEAVHLSVSDVDHDGRPDLAFAYYSSRFNVRTRHLLATGAISEGAERRMATSWLYVDLDGDGRLDEVVGRIYGDAQGLPGDLQVHFASGPVVKVPTQQGVRTLAALQLADDPAATLYFSDGWVATYGKDARARLNRVRFGAEGPRVEVLDESKDEFSFFSLIEASLEPGGPRWVVAQGNRRVSAWRPDPAAPGGWRSRTLADLGPVLNTALIQGHAGAAVVVPGPEATRVLSAASKRVGSE